MTMMMMEVDDDDDHHHHREPESKVGSMEEEALKRKQRLEQLRNKRKHTGHAAAAGDHDNFSESDNNQNKVQLPKPKFRNYNPSDESLKENALPKARPENVKDQLKDELEIAKLNVDLVDDIDLTKLAPKKVDWDLKRNIEKKLDKLEKKTQIAIAELIRERLRASNLEDLDKVTDDLIESSNRNIEVDEDVDD